MNDPIERKMMRFQAHRSYRPRVLDLFAGCGGLSLGFQAAGCAIVAAIEIDETAARTHARNFFGSGDPELAALHALPRDITRVEPEDIVREFGLGDLTNAVDVIVGGPPCQAYARIGRAKLREIADHPHAFKVDPRADLYLRYLHYIARLQPLAILMENVPDIMNFGGHNVMEEMTEALDALGYEAAYSLINSAHHGVPQMRDRVYMIAYRKELDTRVSFPKATHRCDLPAGYKGTRNVALKFVDLIGGRSYREADEGGDELPAAVCATQAIGDLHPITYHLKDKRKHGAQWFNTLAPYRQKRPSDYARSMRTWPGFSNEHGVYDHVMRRLPRDTHIFAAMKSGTEYPAALAMAKTLFEKEVSKRAVKIGSLAWYELRRAMVPPYDPGKFPNRWWKLEPDKPVRTLTAHIGKDTYTHIHYDSSQGRVISVREAARLQSFPDGFKFSGAMNAAYRQIGNAVPPLVAKQLARVICRELRRASRPLSLAPARVAAE